MSKFNLIRNIGILLISAACFVACTPEEYAPCSIPNTSGHKAACAPLGESKTATCTADYVFDCDSLLCGIYNSSSPFCTYRCIPTKEECEAAVSDEKKCTPEGDSKGISYVKCPEGYDCITECPNGAACVEWTSGTGSFFCLPADKKGIGATSSTNPPASSEDNTSTEGDTEEEATPEA